MFISAKCLKALQILIMLTLLRMGLLSYNDETWHIYTLPKEDPKNK